MSRTSTQSTPYTPAPIYLSIISCPVARHYEAPNTVTSTPPTTSTHTHIHHFRTEVRHVNQQSKQCHLYHIYFVSHPPLLQYKNPPQNTFDTYVSGDNQWLSGMEFIKTYAGGDNQGLSGMEFVKQTNKHTYLWLPSIYFPGRLPHIGTAQSNA